MKNGNMEKFGILEIWKIEKWENGKFWNRMVPYGTMRYHKVPYGTIMVPYGTIGYHMVPYGTIRYHRPYGTVGYLMVP